MHPAPTRILLSLLAALLLSTGWCIGYERSADDGGAERARAQEPEDTDMSDRACPLERPDGRCARRWPVALKARRACEESGRCAAWGIALRFGLGVPSDEVRAEELLARACAADGAAWCDSLAAAPPAPSAAQAMRARCLGEGDATACAIAGWRSEDVSAETSRAAALFAAARLLHQGASEELGAAASALKERAAACDPRCPHVAAAAELMGIEIIWRQWRQTSLMAAPDRQRQLVAQRGRRLKALAINHGRVAREAPAPWSDIARARIVAAHVDYLEAIDEAVAQRPSAGEALAPRAAALRAALRAALDDLGEQMLSGETARYGPWLVQAWCVGAPRTHHYWWDQTMCERR